MKLLNKKDNPTEPFQIYIGRGTAYGNPFAMQTHRNDRNVVVELYREYFCQQLLTSSAFREEVSKLESFNNLVCHCSPERCHGDIYLEYLPLQWTFGQEEAIKLYTEKSKYVHLPLGDGVTHVNIYSKSSSLLGSLLSHFTPLPFEHPVHGRFVSVEGFWYYLSTGSRYEELRKLNGYQAKQFGKQYPRVEIDNFLTLIEEANECKITQNAELLSMFKENKLPFRHYYVYGQPYHGVVRDAGIELPRMMHRIKTRLVPSYKTIIAGSRSFCDLRLVRETLAKLPWSISSIVDGVARGADHLGHLYAQVHGIPTIPKPADWDTHGKKAGMIRNREMGDLADKAVIFRRNNSPGSTMMAEFMRELKKEVLLIDCA